MGKNIYLPLDYDTIENLEAGDYVYITGMLYSARDAAHQRLYEAAGNQQSFPFKISGQVIYYMGPSQTKPNQIIGSAGPTTSGRMDAYTPELLDRGLKGMIGKGNRSKEVIQSMIKNHAVYFAATGGAGALLSKCITSCEITAYADLGTEAVRKLVVNRFPAVVAIDSKGRNIYQDSMVFDKE